MSKEQRSYIHGENILVPVKEIPEGKKTSHKSYVVGHSETGHHHVLESKTGFDVVETMAKEVFLDVKQPSHLKHKKTFDIHETVTVEPGLYKIFHAQEYDPFEKTMRRIWD